jgi:divalent metal cation (Fe/Co/Zn/Cd) transporter
MSPRPFRPLPAQQEALLRRAERLEWQTIGLLVAITVMMFLVMGQSQAMKAAWVEDVLSLVPPLAILVAAKVSRKRPDEEYVNGHARAFDVTFLVSAVALGGVGVALVYDSLSALLRQEHATIGAIEIGGHLVWQGWLMMGALVLSSIPPVWLGHRKLKLARELHLKPLHTDADMNKADWMTGLTGVVGIAGIGLGWWWADAVAALLIACSVLRDGAGNLRCAMRDMLDARPETTERGRGDPLVGRVREAVAALDWVARCEVRLHEEGMRLSGVVVVAARDGRALHARLLQAQDVARAVHWRLDEITATYAEA